MDAQPLELQLSLEQKLTFDLYQREVASMSLEEIQERLIDVVRQSMIKDNLLSRAIRKDLGLS